MNCPFYDTCNHIDCENEFCFKKNKLLNLYKESGLSGEQLKEVRLVPQSENDARVFKYLNDIKLNIHNFVKSGENIYLYSSSCGNGKTTWSIKLLKEYINSVWYKTNKPCVSVFVHVPSLLLDIKDSFTTKNDSVLYFKDKLKNADFVVWDELGTKFATDFEKEQLLELINYRISNNKSNMFTSNISPDVQRQLLGDRLYSRTVLSCGDNIFNIESGDMRSAICERTINN